MDTTSTLSVFSTVGQLVSNTTDFRSNGVDLGSASMVTVRYLTYSVKVMYGVCFALSGIALILSTTVSIAIARSIRKVRSYVLLILNLSVIDLVISLSTIGYYAAQYFRLNSEDRGAADDGERAMRWQCYCWQFLFEELWTVSFYANMFAIVLMTVYHLVALRLPHSKCLLVSNKGTIVVALLASWLVAVGFGMVPFFIIATFSHPKLDSCPSTMARFCCRLLLYRSPTYRLNQESDRKLVFSLLTATAILAFVTVFTVYTYLLIRTRVAWCRRPVRPPAASIAPTKRAWKRLAATTAALTGAFCVFCLPQLAYLILHGLRVLPKILANIGDEKMHLVKVSLHSLVCLCSIVDPFIYGMRVPQVRLALANALRIGGNQDGLVLKSSQQKEVTRAHS